MSEEIKRTAPDADATEDIITERNIKPAQAIHTAGTDEPLFIPKKEEANEAPARRFIKQPSSFVSVRAEKLKADTATDISKYSDRLTVAAVPEDVHTGHTGKLSTYDTIHAPGDTGRMIVTSVSEDQLRMNGMEQDDPTGEPTKEADTALFGAPVPQPETTDALLPPDDPTRHFEMQGSRLREIADTAGDDVRRNPDQMMMEGFEEIGKKTEEEIRSEEALKDELQLSREQRVKNFRFWDKAPDEMTDETADEKFSHTKTMHALPAFAARFSERFAHIATPFIPIKAEEYTETGSRKPVFDAIKNARTRSLIGLIVLGVFALVLLITDLCAKVTAGNNSGFFTILGGNVNALTTFNLVFLLLACGVMLPDLKNGAVTVLQLRPKTDALLLFTMLAAVAQTVGCYLTQQKLAADFQLLAPAAVIVCIPVLLAKMFYYDNARQCFKTVSAKSEKSYLRRVTDPQLKARLGCAEEETTVYAGKTKTVSGFPASAESGARGEMVHSRTAAAMGGVSILAGLITLIIKKSPMSGLTVLTLCLALAMPVCCLAAAGFFLSRANAKLSLKSSFIETYADAKSFTAIDSITCDAAALFNGKITNCLTAKNVNEKQVRFAAAAAAAGAGSMIQKLFQNEIETYADKLPPAKNTVYEDKMGISSYVGGCTVLLGNHDMMLNHNVAIPNESVIMRFLSENERPLYLAMEGKFTALFAVQYEAPEEVRRGIRELVNRGTVLLISTTDPNVSDDAAEALLELGENSVRMIGSAAAKKLSAAADAVTESEEIGVVFTSSFLSLARVAAQAVTLDSVNTVCKAICIAGAAVSLLLGLIIGVTGAFQSVSSLTVLALQGVWIGCCFMSPLFSASVVKLLKKLNRTGKKRADEPADETEETKEADAPEEVEDALPPIDFTQPSLLPDDETDEPELAEPPVRTPENDGLPLPAQPAEEEPEDAPEAEPLDSVIDSLAVFAPKDEPAAPAPVEEEEPQSRFISSKALRESLSSMSGFFENLTAKSGGAPQEAESDGFSLYGKTAGDGGSRGRQKDAADIEQAYEHAKAEESAVRKAFTAPEAPKAPLYDLRRKQPEPAPAAESYEMPLDTSDVSVYNDELFRRFEDDAVFEGVHDDEENRHFDF